MIIVFRSLVHGAYCDVEVVGFLIDDINSDQMDQAVVVIYLVFSSLSFLILFHPMKTHLLLIFLFLDYFYCRVGKTARNKDKKMILDDEMR